MTESTATGLDIEAAVRDLIVSVVGETEATNIDIDLVAYDNPAGVLSIGDQARDGCVTVHDDDTVTVWAQGHPHTERHVGGTWDHFATKLERDHDVASDSGYGPLVVIDPDGIMWGHVSAESEDDTPDDILAHGGWRRIGPWRDLPEQGAVAPVECEQ